MESTFVRPLIHIRQAGRGVGDGLYVQIGRALFRKLSPFEAEDYLTNLQSQNALD